MPLDRRGGGERHRVARHGHEVGEAVRVEEHLVVPGRNSVAAFLPQRAGVVHLQDPRNSLLLEPLARVALMRAGRLGDFTGVAWPRSASAR